ncbi:MAG TPA: type VI secretion system-associated FHA domain protein TagH, partial [Steroidobacteraceae bacterium]|nr:type VI secretion system-associated FHA domain protein TagH [Steroidobacteraceae bacterium]
ENAIPGRQPYVLKSGDHVFIDQYDILVGIHQGDPPQAGRAEPLAMTGAAAAPPSVHVAASDDPFGILDAEADGGAVARAEPLIPGAWEDEPTSEIGGGAPHLDPLMLLRGGPARAAIPEPAPVNLQQTDSPLRDPFAPPRPRVAGDPAPRANSDSIPEDWDLAPQVGPARAASAIPDNWDTPAPTPPPPPVARREPVERQSPPAARPEPVRPSPPPAAQAPRPRPIADSARVQPKPRVAPPQDSPRPQPARASGSQTIAIPPPRVEAPLPPVPPVRAPQAVTPEAAPSADARATLAQLLRGAGLSERDLSPEMMNELGQVVRIVVQGVMDVLHARADIKAQFRLPLTRVQARENNPLKLSPNVESALHTLLVQRNPGFLATVPAFEEAFADIRNHQMALLEGVRAAFAAMLESFDPGELQKQFDSMVKRGGPLSGVLGGKPRYWDLYVDRYSALQRDADDTFRRLFGDVFAQAYERQLERLKSLQRNKN